MRRVLACGLMAALVFGGVACKKGQGHIGPNVPGAPDAHEARAAQQLTEQAFEDAEKQKVAASKAEDAARKAQDESVSAAHEVATAQSDLQTAKSDGDRQKAQKKLSDAQQKLTKAQADAQQKTAAARDAHAAAQNADRRYQALSRRVQATVVNPQGVDTGNGATVLPGTVGPLQTAEGKVAQVGKDQLTLQSGQQKLQLQTDGTTQVSLNGRLVQLRELPQGLDARVAFTPGQPPVARRIDAVTQRQPPTGPAAQQPTPSR